MSVVLMGVLFTTTYANNEKKSSLKDRRTYFKEQIKPRVDAQRTKLEPLISEDDKKEISRLRKEIISQKLMEQAFISEVRLSKIKGMKVTEDEWLEIRAQQIVIDNLLDEANTIADKYQPEMDELLAATNAGLSPYKGKPNHEENPIKSMDSVRFLLWDVNWTF